MGTFDEARFDELVLYIAHKTQRDREFGRTKLAKVLFYADFDAYRDAGDSLTGATYIRMPFGPFPKELAAAETRLERGGRARLAYEVVEREEKKIVPIEEPANIERYFEPWQLQQVELWIGTISTGSARSVSERSHDHSGWILAQHVGAEIPYASAFLPEEPPTGLEAERARRVARGRGWLTRNGWIWER